MQNVMEHYAETGQVLGKGTHDLEGFSLEGKGYFGPGELPAFDRGFFDMPHGDTEEWAFDTFREKAKAAGGVITEELMEEFKAQMELGLSQSRDNLEMMELEADYI